MAESLKHARSLRNVVSAGLGARQLSGIQRILEAVAIESEACGCLLWEATPGSVLTREEQSGTFFALAQWFRNGDIWGQSSLPVRSATGHAVAHGLPVYYVDDIRKNEHCHQAEFLLNHNATRVCIIPIRFTDGAMGCLNVFRLESQGSFTEELQSLIQQMAELLPALYETVRDEVAYNCSRGVNDLLQRASSDGSIQHAVRDVIREFCQQLSKNLNCIDVSVYLESLTDRGVFELSGTTLADGVARESYQKGDDGPGAWPITHGKPIRLLDLRYPETFPDEYHVAIPNLRYVQHLQDHAAHKSASPLSFIATPIKAGQHILGVLRCCAPITGPTYFADREVDLITLLAGQLGHAVSDERNRAELQREHEAYEVVSKGTSSIRQTAYDELKAKWPDEDRVLEGFLESIVEALPGEQWVGISTQIATGEYNLRKSVSEPKLPQLHGDRFRLPPEWEKELQEGKVLTKRPGDFSSAASEIWPSGATDKPSVLLCPIRCLNERWLLEIITLGLPKHARSIADLLGSQIGIYHDLLATISTLRNTQSELKLKVETEKRMATAHVQAMADLAHQIRAPLRHAKTRIPQLFRISDRLANPILTKQLQYLRGTVRRASRVASNSGLFSLLATGQTIECNLQPLALDEIRVILIEAAMDNFLIVEETKGMTFGVDDDSFGKLIPKDFKVKLDRDLLDQCLNDLLDNAAKYGDMQSHVKLEVSITKAYFVVTVVSKGLRIAPEQLPSIKLRGERGPVAKLTVGEGSGIGLWIADEIMKAHHGMLDIIPTTPDRVTRIRLMFPLQRS